MFSASVVSDADPAALQPDCALGGRKFWVGRYQLSKKAGAGKKTWNFLRFFMKFFDNVFPW